MNSPTVTTEKELLSVVTLIKTAEQQYNATLEEILDLVNSLCALIGGGVVGAEVCSLRYTSYKFLLLQ